MRENNYQYKRTSKMDWLSQIPSHWFEVRLGSLFNERKSKVSDVDYPPLSVTKNGIVPQLENAAKSNDGDNRKLVLNGDFVINSRSDRKGSSGLSRLDGSVSLINIVLRPIENIDPKFSEYLLKSYFFKEEYYRYGRGIVEDLWTTRYSEMKNMIVPKPPFEEQSAIARFLDYKLAKIDRFIQKKNQLIKLLNEQKAAIINQAVTKGLNYDLNDSMNTMMSGKEQNHSPSNNQKNHSARRMKDSGIEWLGDIPEHWEVRKLKYLGNFQNGISAGAEYFGSGYPFISYGDVYKNFELPEQASGLANSTENERVHYSVKKGDILFTRTSETIEEIGFSSTCLKNIENATFSGFLIRFRSYEGKLFDGFSKYYFRSSLHRRFFVKEMNLVTRASLSQDLLKRMPVLLPPIEEQVAIAKYIDGETATINTTISKIEKEIALVEEYKTALIAEAVTGKIDVREYCLNQDISGLEDEPDLEEYDMTGEGTVDISFAAEDKANYNE